MKLRGRFTLSLALAALVPITVAAVVTRQVIANSYRAKYEEERRGAEAAMRRELRQLGERLANAAGAIAAPESPFAGDLLSRLANNLLDPRLLQEQAARIRKEQALATLTVVDHDDVVIASPHLPGQRFQRVPDVRHTARRTAGAPHFAREAVQSAAPGGAIERVLVVRVARTAQVAVHEIALAVSRRLTSDDLDVVRASNRIDARVVTLDGEVLLPPRTRRWETLGGDPPIRVPLPAGRITGAAGAGDSEAPVAVVEIVVSDEDLASVLRTVTYTSAGLAIAALGVVVLLGLLVAKRTARDLDLLVEGSLAAARGDLDHRVPVRSADEIGAVASAFNFMMEDLRTSKERLVIAERIAAWQEIARRLAHEIKNPLTPIQMAMDTLRKTWRKQHPSFDEILEESTSTVLQEADRLKHIVAEFSDFARMPKPELQRVDLNEVVRASLALYQGAAPLEVELAASLPGLDVDKGQVSQVLLNLVENARDAIGARSDGRITVATSLGEAGDRALIVVEDNGPGVPPELKDKVFAPYFSTKHSKGGTGLGLAIVHRIVSDHGGRIGVSERPGGGARFTIELPLRQGAALLVSRV
jgi:nitrogen fixation/metabolism regulation signal transduction histidine kinase